MNPGIATRAGGNVALGEDFCLPRRRKPLEKQKKRPRRKAASRPQMETSLEEREPLPKNGGAERIKHAGFGTPRIEGLPSADWVLVDAGDVIVHLFRPEVRSFYNLERMWGFGDAAAAGAA